MIPVEGLFFDLDGTLIDSERDLVNSVRALQVSYQRDASHADDVAGFIGDGVTKLIERALPGFTGVALERAVARFKRFYKAHCLDHTRLAPGTRRTLERFRHKKLAVITNKPERISRRILKGLGIADYFQIVVGGDSLRYKKPHPWPVIYTLRALRLHPEQAVLVGDDVNDVRAGMKAGVWTAAVPSTISHRRGIRREKAHVELKRLQDLTRFFA